MTVRKTPDERVMDHLAFASAQIHEAMVTENKKPFLEDALQFIANARALIIAATVPPSEE